MGADQGCDVEGLRIYENGSDLSCKMSARIIKSIPVSRIVNLSHSGRAARPFEELFRSHRRPFHDTLIIFHVHLMKTMTPPD